MAKVLVYINGKPKLVNSNKVDDYLDAGLLHRPSNEGPAICWPDGSEHYYENGKLHRLNGPARIGSDGIKEYWVNGKRHREDGPAAIEPNRIKMWFRFGELHREDGPAIVWDSGDEYYYLNGEKYSKEDWEKKVNG